MKTLAQWLAKIEAGHPTDIDMGLDRVRDVAQRMHLDLSNAVVITVAGTNGKGTTCRLVEQFCLEAGLSVGVYSSPHILQFNERIRINGENASDSDICAAFESIESAKLSVSMTYFEYATLGAMWLFQASQLDVVILEVGLGGRLDATNIIDADINVLTSIALDHQNYLGNTLDAIAYEKVGIVKANKHTVIGYAEHFGAAEQWLSAQHNKVLRYGIDFSYTSSSDGCCGKITFDAKRIDYQWQSSAIPVPNIMTAIATLYWLQALLNKPLSTKLNMILNKPEAASNIIQNTALAGRAQLIHRNPTILLDVAHNEASAAYLCAKIGTFSYSQCHIVVGMLKDKNIEQTLQSLGDIKAHWYCASLPTVRGESYQRLVRSVPIDGAISVNGFDSIANALSSAIKHAENTDMIVVLGSFISVAEAATFFKTHPLD
jgi:dihydrofolate synthase/folylpolyglutamate synthase